MNMMIMMMLMTVECNKKRRENDEHQGQQKAIIVGTVNEEQRGVVVDYDERVHFSCYDLAGERGGRSKWRGGLNSFD